MRPNVGARLAELSGHVFPESAREAFGEHVGILKVIWAAWRPFGPFGPSWWTSWRALGPSWRPS
eukprot:8944911-Pyramimonas_sp.AAC.1